MQHGFQDGGIIDEASAHDNLVVADVEKLVRIRNADSIMLRHRNCIDSRFWHMDIILSAAACHNYYCDKKE